MERLADIAVVLGCSLGAVAFAVLGGPIAVEVNAPLTACLLCAIVVAAAFELVRFPWALLCAVAYCALVAVFAEGMLFLPVVAYETARCLHEPRPWRGFVVAPAAALALGLLVGPDATLALSAVLCAASVALSMRTSALLAQRDVAHRVYDDMRGREFDREGRAGGGAEGRFDGAVSDADVALAGGPQEAVGVKPPVFAELTEREYEVVRLVADGMDNHEIAAAAFISEGTVRNRISSALRKTGLKNRTQLAVAWWRSRP